MVLASVSGLGLWMSFPVGNLHLPVRSYMTLNPLSTHHLFCALFVFTALCSVGRFRPSVTLVWFCFYGFLRPLLNFTMVFQRLWGCRHTVQGLYLFQLVYLLGFFFFFECCSYSALLTCYFMTGVLQAFSFHLHFEWYVLVLWYSRFTFSFRALTHSLRVFRVYGRFYGLARPPLLG